MPVLLQDGESTRITQQSDQVVLERRSERTRITWERMNRLIDKWLPLPITYHPYPLERYSVTTQDRSRMR